MKTLNNVFNYIQENSDSIFSNLFEVTAILSGVLIFAYKRLKSLNFIDVTISFIFSMVAWNALKSIIPQNYNEFYIIIGWLLGASSNKIVEFTLNMIITLGKKAEEYANKKIDNYINDDNN